MSVFQIDDYTIQNLNQAKAWRVSWQTGSIRHHLDLDLSALIKQHIDLHLENLVILLHSFEAGPDFFLSNPMCAAIIGSMPETDTIPGMHLHENDIPRWHHEQLIKGYNRLHNTCFTYDMVRVRMP